MIYDAVNFTKGISDIKEGQIRLMTDTVPNIWWYGHHWGGYSNGIIEYFDIHDLVLYHGNFTNKEFTRQYSSSNIYIRQLAEVPLRNSYQWLNNARNNFKKIPRILIGIPSVLLCICVGFLSELTGIFLCYAIMDVGITDVPG